MELTAHDRSGDAMGKVGKIHIEGVSSRARIANQDTRVAVKLKYSEPVWVLVRNMWFFSIFELPDTLILVDEVIVVGERILVLGNIPDRLVNL